MQLPHATPDLNVWSRRAEGPRLTTGLVFASGRTRVSRGHLDHQQERPGASQRGEIDPERTSGHHRSPEQEPDQQAEGQDKPESTGNPAASPWGSPAWRGTRQVATAPAKQTIEPRSCLE